MNLSSDNESSDSEIEYFVPKDKIDLKSSLFSKTTIKTNNATVTAEPATDSESDNEQTFTNTELLSEILKNLENAKNGLSPNKSKPVTMSSDDIKTETIKQNSVLADEITDLLLKGESNTVSVSNTTKQPIKEEETETKSEENYTVPQEGIKITITDPNVLFNVRKRKQQDLQELLRIRLNQKLRSNQLLIHKVGLLFWISHGFHLNQSINESEVLATALSLVSKDSYPKSRVDLKYLEKFTIWLKKSISLEKNQLDRSITKEVLLEDISNKTIKNQKELVMIYIAILRAMGLNCRLVVSLCPPPLKLKQGQLFRSNKEESSAKNEEALKNSKNTKRMTKSKEKVKKRSKSKNLTDGKSTLVPENSPEGKKKANMEARNKVASILQAKAVTTKSTKKEDDSAVRDTDSESTSRRKLRSKYKNASKKSKQLSSTKEIVDVIEIDDDSKYEEDENSDEDFINNEKMKKFKASKQTSTKDVLERYKKNRKLLSSDEETEEKNVNDCENYWAEVYIESEDSWISVSVINGKINCTAEIYKKAANPVLYIIAWNSEGKLKDVTRRYCPRWLTVTRKQRIDEKWWAETLLPWKEENNDISRAEDDLLLQKELEQPLPKTLSECKGHPLYVIQRHLLKFEALYPPNAVPLGHLPNGDAIYSRHCVHTLCSRETWVKKARVVKPEQEAYKIVKAMPKYDKFTGQMVKNQPLELFGKWQTDPYVPPVAKDGKVPRNEYGNVDLFKMCMIPKGTVHINLPGLNRVARKLDIDCAPACVGFNFGGRGALPAFEGFVVCSEYEDTLREAWEQEQVEAQKRAIEKREKRIYGNWKKLIKGLIIRKRLAARYDFGEDEVEEKKTVKVKNVPTKRKNKEKETISKTRRKT